MTDPINSPNASDNADSRSDDPAQPKACIALIGYRGCGKTTVAREIAAITGAAFVDTDEEITRCAGRSIAEIFATDGEAAFRRMEAEVIARTVDSPPKAISVGGGAILDQINIARLRRVATVVYLTAEPEELWRRVSADFTTDTSRPALTPLAGPEEVRKVLTQRAPLYERAADFMVDTMSKTPRQVAHEILQK
jgi:shikimate kinase